MILVYFEKLFLLLIITGLSVINPHTINEGILRIDNLYYFSASFLHDLSFDKNRMGSENSIFLPDVNEFYQKFRCNWYLIPFQFSVYNAISNSVPRYFRGPIRPLVYARFAHLFVENVRGAFFPPLLFPQTVRKGTQHTVHTAKGANFGLGWIHRARTIKKVCAKPCFPAGFSSLQLFFLANNTRDSSAKWRGWW